MAARYEPSILYKNYDITPVIQIAEDGSEGPAQYIISDIEGKDLGDPLPTLGQACKMIDSINDMLDLDETVEGCFVATNNDPSKKSA